MQPAQCDVRAAAKVRRKSTDVIDLLDDDDEEEEEEKDEDNLRAEASPKLLSASRVRYFQPQACCPTHCCFSMIA